MSEERNTDIHILLHRTVKAGDLITITMDGALLLNDQVQNESQMELM